MHSTPSSASARTKISAPRSRSLTVVVSPCRLWLRPAHRPELRSRPPFTLAAAWHVHDGRAGRMAAGGSLSWSRAAGATVRGRERTGQTTYNRAGGQAWTPPSRDAGLPARLAGLALTAENAPPTVTPATASATHETTDTMRTSK